MRIVFSLRPLWMNVRSISKGFWLQQLTAASPHLSINIEIMYVDLT